MVRRRRGLIAALILLLSTSLLPARGQEDEPFFPILESGFATMEIDGQRLPLEYSQTAAGPLLALQPLTVRIGGDLAVGPLGRSHTLTLGESVFIFGPDGAAVTAGDKILELSQPPIPGGVGLLVPLDLLREAYGTLLGYEFTWSQEDKTLRVHSAEPRELPVTVDAVSLQGVTTLVFHFPQRPRYRLERSGRSLYIRMTGDTLRSATPVDLEQGELIRDIEIRPDAIRIDFQADAVTKDYVLEQPFRLVVDVYRGRAGPTAVTPPPPRDRRPARLSTIVIDPGHGGSDTGARGPSGSLEKDLTLVLARTLKRRLESRSRAKAVLTRDDDVELPLDTRSALANQYKADLFISIHLNSAAEASAKGAETYFLSLEASDESAALAAEMENRSAAAADPQGDPLLDLQLILWDLAQSHHLAQSQRIAALIQEELNLALDLRNRGVKQAPFRVLMGAAMPAVLVELGFLTNPQEEEGLKDPEYRGRLVDTLVRAILRYDAARSAAELPTEEALR